MARVRGYHQSANRDHSGGSMAEQYFSADPSSADTRSTIHTVIRGIPTDMAVSNGVFSAHRLDPGTAVLLKDAPGAAADINEGRKVLNCLDLGCGWGPIAVALAREYPEASVWATDINERAVSLTRYNAQQNRLANIKTGTPESLVTEYGDEWVRTGFDMIWSNPPIRIGKEALHELLMMYLPRLNTNGYAYLVVQKNLGADSLIPWLDTSLNANPGNGTALSSGRVGYTVRKYSSSKGYRVIEIHRLPASGEPA